MAVRRSDSVNRTPWKYFIAFGIVAVVVAATLAVLKAFEAHEVMFRDGSRVMIRKVSYGRDNRFYRSPVRRVVASVSPIDWAWRVVARNFKSLQPMEANSCWQSV